MLSESEKLILSQNGQAKLALFGQEYNDESWAICRSEMLLKDDHNGKIVLGDTLGDGKTRDGFEGERFHYLMANPPFGVEWKHQKTVVEREHRTAGFSGRFGAGLPAINGCTTGRDWLAASEAPPAQMFYTAATLTYVWLVTTRKPPERRGKVQLIDGTRFFRKMKKSLNNKRNEISEDQIRHLARVYGNYRDGETAEVTIDGEAEARVICRIFENREFGFLKVTVERPLRMNFEATPERIARLDRQTAFTNLDKPKKRMDAAAYRREVEEGRKRQEIIRALLATLVGNGRYMDRQAFEADLTEAAKGAGHKVPAPIKQAIFAALGERDPDAAICRDSKGRPEPDAELRDTENISFPPDTSFPLPMEFGPDKPNHRLVKAFRSDIDAYMAREVLPHAPDAWVDYGKTKVGYEIPINRHFYVYKPPRPLDEIEADIGRLEQDITDLLKGLMA